LIATANLSWHGNVFAQIVSVPLLVIALVLLWQVCKNEFRSLVFCDLDYPDGKHVNNLTNELPQICWFISILIISSIFSFWLAVSIFNYCFFD